ncbi:non-ribosomal peptide synthetase [Pedobacter africanus]|uniref:Amino acid adenylation domain-containing protein n=1 Tax=Pedobacter africanus TaxID=151894 RepID=A0A1W2DFM8_9SPHI|nr:non-ribosomal peptide synthetase [Pedobacter africanus]SMC96263.1 amino acid adenylation domain-containing protein [Pedobacter africanus]
MNNDYNLTSVDFNPFEGGELDKSIPAIESQQEIWASCAIGGEDANRSYNESVSLILSGVFDHNSMEKAIHEVANRHEALRATISADGKSLCIYKDNPIFISYEDLSALPAAEQQKRLKEIDQEDAESAFNLMDGPLFNPVIYKLGETEHVVRLTAHHIICDGWSFGIILEDLGKLYSAYAQGQQPVMETPVPFSDYADELERFSQSDEHKKTEQYWLNEYSGNVPVLDLPTDYPRPSLRTYKSRRDDFTLDQDLLKAVRKTGAKAGSSLVSTLMAAFEIYLHRLTGQTDIVLGLPAAGQSATGHNVLVGHCVNLLPLRSKPKGNQSFMEYLKIRKQKVINDYEHQQFTFGSLLKKLNMARDSSRIPLVPVVFNIDMGMDANVSFYGLEHQLISNPRAYESFEIFMNATGTQQSMTLEWSYNTQLFKAESIKRMMEEFTILLEEVVNNPDIRISELSLLDKKQTGQTSNFNDTKVAYPEDTAIAELIGKSATENALKTAIYFKDQEISYKELEMQSNKLAHYFIGKEGLKTGDIVAIKLERSPRLIISILGILKAGAAYLPIDPELPNERIEFMLTDSSASLLLTDQPKDSVFASSAKILQLEQLWSGSDGLSDQPPALKVTGKDLAYLLYTSGSTGRPKGVLIEHHSITNLMLSLQKAPGIQASDRFLASTTISFDIAGVEMYLPLISGASIVLAETNDIKDGRLLLDLIEKQNVSIVQATPSSWRILVEAGLKPNSRLRAFCGGEQFPADLAGCMLDLCDAVWNMYGPTETTVYSIIKQLQKDSKSTTIGKPINNTQVYLLDAYGHPVNDGVPGEICIAGAGLARGYLNRPELTAESFASNNFINPTPTRIYRTGDLGKLNQDNDIECLGRVDQQLKVRGFRIEPGEIEHHLIKQRGVKEAVVIAREDKAGDQRLVAYIVPDQKDGTGWQERWEDLYQLGVQNEQDLPLEEQNLDIAIISQYNTDENIREHGIEWTNEGLKRIRALKANDIMELGTGGGHLMLTLGQEVNKYVATDYSHVAISKLKEKLALAPEKWKHVRAYEALADDFTGVDDNSFDLVFFHGVVQYFPSLSYVLKVIEGAVKAVRAGGCIYIGDPQTLDAITMHFYHDQLGITKDDVSVADFKKISDFRIRKEEEISIDVDFFYFLPNILPEIKAVDVQIRGGDYSNEATKCHYDVWLYIGGDVPNVVAPEVSLKYEGAGIGWIAECLSANKGKVVQVTAIPNRRVSKDVALMQLVQGADAQTSVKQLKEKLQQLPVSGINPTDLWELGEKSGYKTHVRWSANGEDGNVEAVFIPEAYGNAIPSKPEQLQVKSAKEYGLENDHEVNVIDIPEHQLQLLKNELKNVLPEYMIPGEYVALDKLPVSSNGKIDRKNLPKPDHESRQENEGSVVEPRTATEKMIAGIWSELLNIEKISITSNFFELGGHSLIAVKVMLAIGKETGIRLPITTLFENSTIQKLAKVIAPDSPDGGDDEGGPGDQDDPFPGGGTPNIIHVPTIDPQKEIWLACELGGTDASKAFNLSFSQYFHGSLNADALKSSIQQLVNRHQSLRATFHKHGAEMHISEHLKADWHYYDLSLKSEADQNQFIEELSVKNTSTPFDLSEGPLFRTFLIKLSDQQHYFTIATHHIVFDGWSYGVAMHELGILYSAIVNNTPTGLDEPALFSEYALKKQAYYGTADYKDIENYWLGKFQGELPVMELPLDFPRPKNRSYESERVTYTIDSKLASGIKKIAVSANTSIAITLRAALEVLLYRLTGQEDIITGLPVAGQLVEVKDNLIGHCVNMLPLRTSLDGDAAFLSYLNRRKQEILEAYSYQDITFGHLLEILNTSRDQSRAPLISVVMNTALWMDEGASFSGVRNELVENRKSFENFELILDVVEYVDSMTIRWDYNKSLFTPQTIYLFHQRFAGLLSQITKDPALLLDKISLIVADDLSIQKKTPAEKTVLPALGTLINEAAKKYAAKSALLFKNQTLSYQQLNQRSNQLAHYLIESGIKPGHFTALSLDRTPDMIVVLLAIIKAGSAYLPIDINYPKERISQILLNARPELLIVQKDRAENYVGFEGKLYIDDVIEASKTYPDTEPKLIIPDNNPVYVLHTSGSTGKPKGVCMANDALVNLLQWQAKCSIAGVGSKTLQFSPLPFDVSFQEIFSTLLTGGYLSLISDEVRLDPRSLLEHLKSTGINRIFLPFVALQSLTESAAATGTYPDALKEVMTAGEQLKITPQIVSFFKKIKGCVLFNQYGPTEAHVVTQLELTGDPEQWPNLPPIGKPIDNTQILILNKQLKEEPAGVVGELCIAGTCLAEGYVNLPELTNEKFITLEQKNFPGLRLYRTGDLARYQPDGNIEFLGREDNQVKIRGFRIELGEIEAYLNKEPEIKQAVVTVQKDQSGNTRLIANLTAHQLGSLSQENIEQWKDNLRSNLPEYMIPFEFVLLKEFPLTATGKIDRKAIPKLSHFSDQQTKVLKVAKTPQEIILAKIWSDALGISNISIDSDFFEIGGHSLIAVKVMVAIEAETGKRLPLAALFENPSIEKLAKLLNADEEGISWDSLVPIKTSGGKPPLYIVHGWGLNVLGFRNLANVADPEQPVYGLQAKGLNGSDVLFHTTEETAAHYVNEIMLHNPSGPYFLSGYSSGGVVAFEMARQLKELGKEVAFLAFFDSFVTINDYCELKKKGKILQMVSYFIKKQIVNSKFFIRHPKAFIIDKFNFTAGTLYNIYARLKPKKKINKDDPEYAIRQLAESHDRSLKNYHFKPYDGHAYLFKSNDPETTYFNNYESNGWGPFLSKGLTRINVPIGHLDFFEPRFVSILADKLQEQLDQAAKQIEPMRDEWT